ncbi:MAG: GNAT family N-acetyltransferase [Clostridia bacterium]|nr:GNAT family N-acetyltransferase [Clostridia bacterium]
MRLNGETRDFDSDITALVFDCFGMSSEESALMLADAEENGARFVSVSDGKPVSSLFSKELILRSGGAAHRCMYIFGLCTAPEFRGRGLASGLIDEACRQSEAEFALLIPEREELYGFYEKLGFLANGAAAVFDVAAEGTENVKRCVNVQNAYAAYRSAVAVCDNICLLSESDFSFSMRVCGNECFEGEKSFCIVGDGSIKEIIAPRERIEAFAASVLKLCGIGSAKAPAPVALAPENAEVVKLGMIKRLKDTEPPQSFYVNNLYNL